MRPRPLNPTTTDDFYRNRLSNIINQRQELLRLAGIIDWSGASTVTTARSRPSRAGLAWRPG
jgi:hypothetical protein